MKHILSIFLLAIVFTSCSNGQTHHTLSPKAFSEKMNEFPDAVILDVRTPEEFSNGHLENAVNYDWNGTKFGKQIASLDKSKPVFVYCLSGGRSAAAASKMRADGFTKVYEMEGGMMKWRSEQLPETKNSDKKPIPSGMNKQAFDALINSDKTVLVDFYADWCVPCKKMEPYLKEISADYKNTVVVIRINADENQALCQELGISAIPVLQVYKNQKMTWTNTGFIEKGAVLKQLE